MRNIALAKSRMFASWLAIGLVGAVLAAPAAASGLVCDESLKTAFHPDSNTTVLQVQQVHKGDKYPVPTMEQMVFPDVPATFGADLCWVKLLVGPGNPGPADAPSTSKGVAIEIWLPAKQVWNHRVHAIGGSGSTGSDEGVVGKISNWTGAIDTRAAPRVAAEEGAVTSTTDSAKGSNREFDFLLNPDGSLNRNGLRDWNYRSLYEQAVKTKALAKAYYGTAPKFSYFDGASGGGRQAFHVARNLPNEYDGIVAGDPAFNWVEMTANMWPGLVILNDLGGKPMSKAQLDLVSNAAIQSCDLVGGKHLGFVIDNAHCTYDPTKDKAVLCATDGGSNPTPDCVSRVQALAINKIWYGPTADGSVPDPAVDNGWQSNPGGTRLWFGVPRGTALGTWAIINGSLSADNLAVLLGNPAIAGPTFKNATGNGTNAWKSWTYAQYAEAWSRASANAASLDISANQPDLTAFKAHGGKFIHTTHANSIPLIPQGGILYYHKLVDHMGAATVDSFYRQYLYMGTAHGNWNGTSNPNANPPVERRGQMYALLTNWVEKGVAPGNVIFTSDASQKLALADAPTGPMQEKSIPVCALPRMPSYIGGDIFKATSYRCQ